MDMIVNSLYSNRDVFLRELVSNASDALDKARFNALKDGAPPAGDLKIRVRSDKDANTIVVEDSGIGMSREDLLSSLGTIARSGTAKFAEAAKAAADGDASGLIGQFGVGFYSAFLVADKVSVLSRAAGEATAHEWTSSAGAHSYTVREVGPDELGGGGEGGDAPMGRGTRVTLHLKPDADAYLAAEKLTALVKQYSEFIAFPIEVWAPETVYDDVEDPAATAKAQAAADEAAAKEGKEKADPVAPVMIPTPREEWGWRVQNATKPLWTRPPKDVTDAEYAAFYKATFRDFVDPAAHAHFSVEGTLEFTALLFIPGMPPFEAADWLKPAKNIRLFVKRVFISDDFDEALLPRWCSFVKGVVDSADLPLNVSREILQESRVVRTIRKQLVRRTLDALADLAAADAKEGAPADGKYASFWEGFGKYLKLGAIEDESARKAIAPLLRFASSAGGAKDKAGEAPLPGALTPLTSLADYVARMKPDQAGIFYIAADSAAAAADAPFVGGLVAKGYEVLFLTEPIDEPALSSLGEFDGKKFVDVTREGLSLGGEADKEAAAAAEAAAGELEPLLTFAKAALGATRVEKVVVSTRLPPDAPCALVVSSFGWSAYQERVMKAQALGDAGAAEYMKGKKTLELNPAHPVVRGLAAAVVAAPEAADPPAATEAARAAVELLYDAALVTSGFAVESPKAFAGRIYEMIGAAVKKE
jgi:heat shock protein beta